ncbi:hypothetical protein EJV47_17730 [Hymenobacter gummosus]|uniref:Uncharacterized protein n=1 Tax=Hymenobacter gummosus TaxID=1776032 RepID=A0A3S0H7K7_9BACT|nr:hypothetical protein [Hymenobacter gummosus]RTQ47761.1 hypothetical protein EJV47_17730 [Hymenobacter gummosus]
MRLLILSTLLLLSCGSKQGTITQSGILVLDSSRNHTSFEYFIPCAINDTIPLGKNLASITQPVAHWVDPAAFDWAIIRSSWVSTPDSFYITQRPSTWLYVAAVEATFDIAPIGDNRVTDASATRLGGLVTVRKFSNQQYRITHLKQYLLPE